MIFNQTVINYVIIVVVLLGIYNILKTNIALEKEKNRLGFMELSIDVEQINDTIDKFVEACFTEYLAYNPQLNNEVYINSTLEKEIVTEVTKLCTTRLSPVLFDKFSLCYAADTIGEIISRKVYMRALIYQMDHEQFKREEMEAADSFKNNLPESN